MNNTLNTVLVTEKLLLIDTSIVLVAFNVRMFLCKTYMFLGDKETGLSAPYVRCRTCEGPVCISTVIINW